MPKSIHMAVPTMGLVDIRWATMIICQLRPMNTYTVWSHLVGRTGDDPVGDARNFLVKRMLRDKFATHIMFIDDDVIVPPDALIKLHNRKLPIVGGIYGLKQEEPQPLLFKEFGEGVIMDWEPHELIKVKAMGMGCTMIRREVFESIPEPWFKTTQGQTEDIYFCKKAAEQGWEIYADPEVECVHWDITTGTGYTARKNYMPPYMADLGMMLREPPKEEKPIQEPVKDQVIKINPEDIPFIQKMVNGK